MNTTSTTTPRPGAIAQRNLEAVLPDWLQWSSEGKESPRRAAAVGVRLLLAWFGGVTDPARQTSFIPAQ